MNFENYKNFVKENDGDEIYLEELNIVSGILKCSHEEVMFINSDEDYKDWDKIDKIKSEPITNERGYNLHNFKSVEFVTYYHEGGLEVLFIKESEIEKLGQYVYRRRKIKV